MKARIPRLQPKLLVCGFASEKLSRVRSCAAEFNASVIEVNDPNVKLNEIAGNFPPAENSNNCGDLEECAVFCNFQRSLDALLDSLHESGIDIPLKAVLTPYNSKLTFSQLIPELKREREQLSGGDEK